MRPLVRTLATIALGLGLAAAPAVAGPAAAFAAPSTDYVALGDSYSAGTGTNSYDINASCQRSSLSYPALWAAQQGTASFTSRLWPSAFAMPQPRAAICLMSVMSASLQSKLRGTALRSCCAFTP